VTPEQRIYVKLRKELIEIGAFVQRIETSTGTGIPDVVCVMPGGCVFWVETKVLGGKFTREQYAWASRWEDLGGISYVVTVVNGQLVWLRGCSVGEVTSLNAL